MAEQMMQDAAGKTIPAGYKQTEVGVIPEDWSFYRLGDLEPYITSGSRGWAKYYSKHGDVFVRITNMSRESIYLDLKDICYVMIDAASSEGKRTSLEEGDVLVSITADIGICSYIDSSLDKPAFINQHIALIRFNHAKINSKFIAYYLSSHQIQKLFKGSTDQGAKAGMNLAAVRMIKTALPTLQEQTAIANVLSDSDALIAGLEQLIAKKQAIKTATMQQLLTGRTRLPQFALRPDGTQKGYKSSELGQIPEDWKVVCLDDIGQSLIGLTYSPKDVSDDGVLVLRSSNVQNGRLAYEDTVFVQMDLPDRVMVKEGDILICVRNGSRQLIGKCALIDKSAQGFAFGAFMSVYRTEAHGFVFYQFQSDVIQSQINETMGATINQITNRDMARFKIMIPKSIEEQTAIATILSDMDSELTALEQKLAKARDVKQGMMQQLLTGRIRLPIPQEA